jgi:O-antigen ligase
MRTDKGRRVPSVPGRSGRGASRSLALSEKGAALGLLLLVFCAVAAFGASEIGVAAMFSGLYALYLLVLLGTCDWARRALGRLSGLTWQAALFGLLMLAVLWPLTAWGPGGPHPAWSYLPGRAASLTLDRSALILNVLQLLGLGCLFVSGRIIGASESRARWTAWSALVLLGLYAGAAFVDHVVIRTSPRLTGTLLSPNTAATLFGAGLVLTVATLTDQLRRGADLLKRPDFRTIGAILVAAVLATALISTASRTGVAATLAGLGLFLLWGLFVERHRLRGGVAMAGLIALLFIGAIGLRGADILTTRLEAANHDLAVRGALFTPHWQAFLSSPWSGFGLGAFPTVNQLVMTRPLLGVLSNVRAAHNIYLQWLEEAGVVGACAMLALFLAVVLPMVRGGLRSGWAGAWQRATLCAAAVFLIHGVTDFALQAPAVQAAAAVILGLGASLALGVKPGERSEPTFGSVGAPAVAGVTFVAAVLLGAPLLAGRLGGDLSSWPTAPAEALAERIESALVKPRLGPDELKRLTVLSDRELNMRPASGAAWLRRAAIDAAAGRQDAANLALEHSFAVAPLQTSLFAKRSVFAYENWQAIGQVNRDQAIYQFKIEWLRDYRPERFVALANGLTNPAGRVGMALQIAVLRSETRYRPVEPQQPAF